MDEKSTKAVNDRKCYWRRHLTGASYAVYDVLAALTNSRKLSEISISIRAISGMLAYHPPAVVKALRQLEDDGWIERFPSSSRRKATTYGVVAHDEWVSEHLKQADLECRSTDGSVD